MEFMSMTFDTSQSEISTLKDLASLNMSDKSVACDTSHPEMSVLNNVAPLNMLAMSVT